MHSKAYDGDAGPAAGSEKDRLSAGSSAGSNGQYLSPQYSYDELEFNEYRVNSHGRVYYQTENRGSRMDGFDAGEVSAEDVVDHENNWTRKLRTDDQTILMTAKEAQKMESNALLKYEEIQLLGTGITIDPREWVR